MLVSGKGCPDQRITEGILEMIQHPLYSDQENFSTVSQIGAVGVGRNSATSRVASRLATSWVTAG